MVLKGLLCVNSSVRFGALLDWADFKEGIDTIYQPIKIFLQDFEVIIFNIIKDKELRKYSSAFLLYWLFRRDWILLLCYLMQQLYFEAIVRMLSAWVVGSSMK